MRLAVTRPLPEGERTAQALRTHGHDVVLAPLLHVETIDGVDLGPPPFAGILISSANAARAIAGHPRFAELAALPLLAVGERSAEAARGAGFSNVASSDGDAGDLARIAAVRFSGSRAPLLYLAGEDRARDLSGGLAGLTLRTIVVYRARKAENLPRELREALAAGRLDGVLHFSLRTAEAYVALAQAADLLDKALVPLHFCLSARIAAVFARAPNVRTAARPTEAAMFDLIESPW